jgi:tetratricopeptide (TPR) repeat protein
MSAARVARASLLALSLAACGPSLGDAYEASFAKGQRAYHAGRYEEAAKAYEEAAQNAERIKDRDEALFLVARMHERSGAHDEAKAALEKLVKESPDGPRRGRAAFDLANLEIEHGDADKGFSMLLDAAAKYPKNGLARRAVKRAAEHERERGGDEAVLAWTKGPARVLLGTEVEENLMYEAAIALENLGRSTEARDALLALAEAHPFPFGSLFDDALWRASLVEQKLGRNEAAIEHLRTLLATRESSHMTGSYERPRYSPSQMRIAELYRDALHDDEAARREFHKVYADHPTSTLRDDALWEEARLAKKDGDQDEACSLVKRLRKEFADSRYAPCARLLCPEIELGPKERACAGYIERALETGTAVEDEGPSP